MSETLAAVIKMAQLSDSSSEDSSSSESSTSSSSDESSSDSETETDSEQDPQQPNHMQTALNTHAPALMEQDQEQQNPLQPNDMQRALNMHAPVLMELDQEQEQQQPMSMQSDINLSLPDVQNETYENNSNINSMSQNINLSEIPAAQISAKNAVQHNSSKAIKTTQKPKGSVVEAESGVKKQTGPNKIYAGVMKKTCAKNDMNYMSLPHGLKPLPRSTNAQRNSRSRSLSIVKNDMNDMSLPNGLKPLPRFMNAQRNSPQRRSLDLSNVKNDMSLPHGLKPLPRYTNAQRNSRSLNLSIVKNDMNDMSLPNGLKPLPRFMNAQRNSPQRRSLDLSNVKNDMSLPHGLKPLPRYTNAQRNSRSLNLPMVKNDMNYMSLPNGLIALPRSTNAQQNSRSLHLPIVKEERILDPVCNNNHNKKIEIKMPKLISKIKLSSLQHIPPKWRTNTYSLYAKDSIAQDSQESLNDSSSTMSEESSIEDEPVLYMSYFEAKRIGYKLAIRIYRNRGNVTMEEHAAKLKDSADKSEDEMEKIMLYMESSIYYMVAAEYMERENACTILFEVLRVLKNIAFKLRNPDDLQTEERLKLTVVSQRCQSLNLLKLYRLKRQKYQENVKHTSAYFRGQNLTQSTSNSDMQASNLKRLEGEVLTRQRLESFDILRVNCVYLNGAIDMWDHTDTIVLQSKFVDSFVELDRSCGSLSFHSSMLDVFRYVNTVLMQIRNDL